MMKRIQMEIHEEINKGLTLCEVISPIFSKRRFGLDRQNGKRQISSQFHFLRLKERDQHLFLRHCTENFS